MERLIKGTIAYKIMSGDAAKNALSHAYMLYFNDRFNLRSALKIFALKLFGTNEFDRVGRLILNESYSDLKIYPDADKKLSVADAGDIVSDSALRPVEGDKKLYIISDFDTASPLIQNKLLKVLEEPPQGVYFLLGATSLSPVLDTVRSRVKLLEIPPFTEEQVLEALNRQSDNPKNREVAASCGGCLGLAQNMLSLGWYAAVHEAAQEICHIKTLSGAGDCSIKYGDVKYKNELLSEMQRIYFGELENLSKGGKNTLGLEKATLIYALESINDALQDVKYNANFQAVLYDFTVRVLTENDKWKKL